MISLTVPAIIKERALVSWITLYSVHTCVGTIHVCNICAELEILSGIEYMVCRVACVDPDCAVLIFSSTTSLQEPRASKCRSKDCGKDQCGSIALR
jgi:hypothetical protein